MHIDRRRLGKALLAAPLMTTCLGGLPAWGQTARTRLILLGTQGGPNFNLERGETASVLVVDDVPYLVDCGYGAMAALHAAGINFLAIADIFLTHLHDDHVADLAALLSHQWTQGRVAPTTVFGPSGTDALVDGALAFTKANADIRFIDEGRSIRPEPLVAAQVVPATGEVNAVFADARIRVSSIENTHFPDWAKARMPYRSLAYRFDTPDRSVVFSGDTAYSDNVISLARGADVLVAEVIEPVILRQWFDEVVAAGGYQDNPENIWTHIADTHLTTEDAGRMAAAAGVGTLVLNHLLPGALREVDDDYYLEGIRRNYDGAVIVGHDGQVI